MFVCVIPPLYLQNHLLEVGWNKSKATQMDVEKTLNCCGFSYVNYNGSCNAVSKQYLFFFSINQATLVLLSDVCLPPSPEML